MHLATISGYARGFVARPGAAPSGQYPWLITPSTSGCGMKSDALKGKAQSPSLSIEVLDIGRGITADMATTVFEGKAATLVTGFEGLDPSDYIQLGSFIVESVECANNNLRYRFNMRDPGLRLLQYIWDTGDDGWPTSDAHPRTVIGNPMDILLEVLDAVGYTSGQINSGVISAYKTSLFDGMTMQWSVTQMPQAGAWLDQEIFAPLAGFGFWNSAGLYTPQYVLPLGVPTPAFSFTNTANILGVPQVGVGDYCAQMLTMMDFDGHDYLTGVGSSYDQAIALYGLPSIVNQQARGLRSASGGGLLARLSQFATFRRCGLKPRTLNLLGAWTSVRCEIGDVVTVTHPLVPDKDTGTMGITNRWYEVISRNPNWGKPSVQFELLDVNWMNAPAYEVAPDDTPTWADSSEEQRATYAYAGEGQKFY